MKKWPTLSKDWTREPTTGIEVSFLWFVHFSNKCPNKKKRNDEGYSKNKQTYKGKRTTKKVFKKILCTKEDISSSNEDSVGDSETERVLFMTVEDFDKENTEEEYEEAK